LQIHKLTGAGLESALKDLAQLRIEVFRDFPYLYDGTLAYEEGYMAGLAGARDAIVAAAEEDGRIVGCATGSALAGHHEEFAAPFAAHDYDPARSSIAASPCCSRPIAGEASATNSSTSARPTPGSVATNIRPSAPSSGLRTTR